MKEVPIPNVTKTKRIIPENRRPTEEEIIKHKRTGKVYASKDHFDTDVADSNTDTTVDDLQQDVAIEVASLQVFGKTK